ncbi:MAG: hypothetical protein I8H75_02075 [Myxococcaceae bacterium]|nr:hypothetical protein [Myxococcaceae bacterium]MBH2006123.1 hypothetical protein [Myxococcaceae bacterium]
MKSFLVINFLFAFSLFADECADAYRWNESDQECWILCAEDQIPLDADTCSEATPKPDLKSLIKFEVKHEPLTESPKALSEKGYLSQEKLLVGAVGFVAVIAASVSLCWAAHQELKQIGAK